MVSEVSPTIRPALDLLSAVPLETVERLVDLGSGPGNVIPYFREAYPGAEITAVDRSTEWLMLARSHHGDALKCVQGDIARWQPDQAPDLIYANAALNQVGDHEHLFPRLMGFLRSGGVLAVQMPHQYGELSHTLTYDVASEGPWVDILTPVLKPSPVARADQYRAWLAPLCTSVEIWETAYDQILVGRDAVIDWVFATELGRLREALPPDLKGPFRTALADKLRAAYPPGDDGKTTFAFRRLFIIAVKG